MYMPSDIKLDRMNASEDWKSGTHLNLSRSCWWVSWSRCNTWRICWHWCSRWRLLKVGDSASSTAIPLSTLEFSCCCWMGSGWGLLPWLLLVLHPTGDVSAGTSPAMLLLLSPLGGVWCVCMSVACESGAALGHFHFRTQCLMQALFSIHAHERNTFGKQIRLTAAFGLFVFFV